MDAINLITQSMIDAFVRAEPRRAQEIIPELVYNLICAADQKPTNLIFPLGDSVGQHGPDGILTPSTAFPPFFPAFTSYWQVGTDLDPGDKATRDYKALTKNVSEDTRQQSAFIFVTPLSGVRNTWVEKAKDKWIKKRQDQQAWLEIRVIDGTQLINWMQKFPGVDRWLALQMDEYRPGLRTVSQHWAGIEKIGDPPPLKTNLFLKGRDNAASQLQSILQGETSSLELRIETRDPDDFLDFVSAVCASIPAEQIAHLAGRCIIVENEECWRWITTRKTPHVLIVAPNLSLGNNWQNLFPLAKENKHTVIYAALPGGVPNWNSILLPGPSATDIETCLREIGYSEERARRLSTRCGQSLQELKLWIQNLSTFPEWTQGSSGAELRLATVIGSWRSDSVGDREAIEAFLGKSYGEWITNLIPVAARVDAPLKNNGEVWGFTSRFRAWQALGKQITDEDLEKFQMLATTVLSERDPQFELEPEDRMFARMRGKVGKYSATLREGIANTLALLGSYPAALSACTPGKPEVIAVLTLRKILENADWIQWASLNDVLPLLAEAAPDELLDALESVLKQPSESVFPSVFAQERSAIEGRNYMTGLLWGLETLAWHEDYLIRVAVILGQLAEIDPGGNWTNRPLNSITTILLPWFPQTCAPVSKRKSAVEAVIEESPEIGGKLLLTLLPSGHGISSGSRKPAWREFIPSDYSNKVTTKAYWDEIGGYAELAVRTAAADLGKLRSLIERLPDLPAPAHTEILKHLSSEIVLKLPDSERSPLWEALVSLASKHRKFPDAKWVMENHSIERIEEVAQLLRPSSPHFYHRRLFGARDFELMDASADYEEQRRQLEVRRQEAISEIFRQSNIEGVLEFTKTVSAPWQVGLAFGAIGPQEVDAELLPKHLAIEDKTIAQFMGGFVWARFWKSKWEWVDRVITQDWNLDQKTSFLLLLPFERETWKRVDSFLVDRASTYWKQANANPYQGKDDLGEAVERLLEHDRPRAAIQCLETLVLQKGSVAPTLVSRALIANLNSEEPTNAFDRHAVIELIKWLQGNGETDPKDLFKVEWAYLALLDRFSGSSPKHLEKQLAEDPSFFCEIIRTIFKSKREDVPVEAPTEEKKRIAENAYRLLHQWQTPPGTTQGAEFDVSAFNKWLAVVKKSSTESGHFGIAMSQVGQVLPYAPPDSTGLWIQKAVAEALNAKDAEEMRSGFTTELFNMRGVHGFSGGTDETELSKQYRERANALDDANFHRFATSIRELAVGYERDAKREAARNPFEDL
jgi:hypothetical protein